jgi:hypothetical protein
MSWSAVNPLVSLSEQTDSDITNTSYKHLNPIYQLMVKEIFTNGKYQIHKSRLKWRVMVECEFLDANDKKYYRARELVIHSILDEADGHYQQAVEEMFAESNMAHYVTTNITCTILGDCGIKDEDFVLCGTA